MQGLDDYICQIYVEYHEGYYDMGNLPELVCMFCNFTYISLIIQ